MMDAQQKEILALRAELKMAENDLDEALRVGVGFRDERDVALQRAFDAEGKLSDYDHEAAKRQLREEAAQATKRAEYAEHQQRVAEQLAAGAVDGLKRWMGSRRSSSGTWRWWRRSCWRVP